MPGGQNVNPLQYSCLENPHGQRSLAGDSPWGHREIHMTEQLVPKPRKMPQVPVKVTLFGNWVIAGRIKLLRCCRNVLFIQFDGWPYTKRLSLGRSPGEGSGNFSLQFSLHSCPSVSVCVLTSSSCMDPVLWDRDPR